MSERKIMTRAANRIRFRDADMDFNLNWILGVSDLYGWSHGEVLFTASRIKDGDATSWRREFRMEGQHLLERAKAARAADCQSSAGQALLGACAAFRAALQYCDPSDAEFAELLDAMEQAFQSAVQDLRIPVREVEVPFEGATLPGYFLQIDERVRPTVVMVGGGDTFREDLFCFAGYAGWKRDYNVLMVDLPGQGKTPGRGLHFRTDSYVAISTVIDWLEDQTRREAGDLALFGVSGGGYFSAQAVVADKRVKAWVASTPITDVAKVFRSEMAGAIRTPGWMMRVFTYVVGRTQTGFAISLKKYAWQFGTSDFATAFQRVLEDSVPLSTEKIDVPSLFLVGEAEAPELKRQSQDVSEALRGRGVDVTLREFKAADGADAHCQVNNLRLLHSVVFDWLDQAFERGSASVRLDPRLLC